MMFASRRTAAQRLHPQLSAIGDACTWCRSCAPYSSVARAQLTWIIGKPKRRLMSLIEGVEFITVQAASLSALRRGRQLRAGASMRC